MTKLAATVPTLNPQSAAMAEMARALYTEGSAVMRAMQHYRPYISPFGPLLDAVPRGSSVLDIGCGGGLFLGLLARTGRIKQGLGIDTSLPAIAVAQAMCARLPAGHGLRFESRSAALPLPREGHDVVTLLDVMHHIPPAAQRTVLEQAIGTLQPGGRFIYKDMVQKPRWRAAANRTHDLLIARQWIHYLALDDAVAWARAAGCRVTEQHRIDMLWYGHDIVVFEKPAP